MKTFRFKLPFIGLAISWMLMLLIATPALADTPSGGLETTISGAGLHMNNLAAPTVTQDFSLDGKDATITFKIPIEVNDERGTGAGWNLYVNAQQLNMVVSGTTLHTLTSSTASTPVATLDMGVSMKGLSGESATGLGLGQSNLGCVTGSDCTLPASTSTTTVHTETAQSVSEGVVSYDTGIGGAELFTASTSNGMGDMYLEADFTVTVPASEIVIYGSNKTYDATFQFAGVSTPV